MEMITRLNALREEKLGGAGLIKGRGVQWVRLSVARDDANRDLMLEIGRGAADILFARKMPRGRGPRWVNVDSTLHPNRIGYLDDIVHSALMASTIPFDEWYLYADVFYFYIKKHSKKFQVDDEEAVLYLGEEVATYPKRFDEDFRGSKVI